jgi:IclR family transcriptional regulator, acetate operon repressor
MSATVKSATRVLKVLEYFDGIRREAGVTEVARALGYPTSSTAGLLQSLVDLGYLVQDEQRNYRPTPRVTLLGAWIDPLLAPGGPVLSMMEELNAATGETIILGIPSGITVRYIHVVPATKPMRLHVGPGDVRPIISSGIGRLFLSQMGDEELRRTVFRYNSVQQSDDARVSLATVRRDVESIRSCGHSVSIDRISKGAGLVCVALPARAGSAPMAVAVAGLSTQIRSGSEQIARQIKDSIRRHLGAEPRGRSSARLVKA